MESLHLGGNYGRGNNLVFWEQSTKNVWFITDWGHGKFSRTLLPNLSGKDIHGLTNLSDQFLKQFSKWDGIIES